MNSNRTESLDTQDIDILKTCEITPHDLTHPRLGLEIKRPFLGLVSSGEKATVRFRAHKNLSGMQCLLIKARIDGPVKLSHKLIQLEPNRPEDEISVEQSDPVKEPSRDITLDIYSTGVDFCQRNLLVPGTPSSHTPHTPACKHHLGSVTLHYSLAYAKFLAVAMAIASPFKWFNAKAALARDELRLRAYNAYISFLRLKKRMADAPATAREKLQTLHDQTIGRASQVPAVVRSRTRMISAESRNRFRGLRRNPLVGALAILILGLAILMFAHRYNSSPTGEASAESSERTAKMPHATIVVIECRDGYEHIGEHVFREKCTFRGIDGEPPDRIECHGDYRLVPTPDGNRLVGCENIWLDDQPS